MPAIKTRKVRLKTKFCKNKAVKKSFPKKRNSVVQRINRRTV